MNKIVPNPSTTKISLFVISFCSAIFVLVGCSSNQELLMAKDINTYEESYFSRSEYETASFVPVITSDSIVTDLVMYAQYHNPGLKAFFYRWKATLQKVPQARSLTDPRITYAYFIEKIETRVGPQRQRIGVGQTFPWFGKLDAKSNMALASAFAEQNAFEYARQRLFRDVKNTYWDYWNVHSSISITQRNIQLLKSLEVVARSNYTTGKTPYTGVVQTQVEIGKLEDSLSSLMDTKRVIASHLNALLNRDPDSFLPEPPDLQEYPIFTTSYHELLSLALNNNPELLMLYYQREKEQHTLRLAKKEFYPDITLGFEYIDTEDAMMPDVQDSGKDPVIAMVSFNIPIWYWKYRAIIREAEARYESVTHEYDNRRNLIQSDIMRALVDIRDAQRKIQLYRDTLIPKANESLNVTRQSFLTGTSDYMNFIDAQRILLEFQMSQITATSRIFKAISEIEMLTATRLNAKIQQ